MTPWLTDPDVTLYHGDCLDVLRTLPDRSVHMVATSPPFYGLRDYGTGEWDGGDLDCDHLAPPGGGTKASGLGNYDNGLNQDTIDAKVEQRRKQYGAECRKCGARRVDRQIGLEETPDQWVERLVAVFRECRRVLRDDGTLWVEIGDSYASVPVGSFNGGGFKDKSAQDGTRDMSGVATSGSFDKAKAAGIPAKNLLGQPWLLAFALRADGWYLRSEIIWARPNPMPESVTDRPTKSHSTVFLLSKQPRYFYDADAIREPHSDKLGIERFGTNGGRSRDDYEARTQGWNEGGMKHRHRDYNPAGANARSVWTIPTEPTPFAHFATWPQALVRRMILAGTSEKGCCPECGAPWVRDTETSYEDGGSGGAAGGRGDASEYVGKHGGRTTAMYDQRRTRVDRTVGWSPSCAPTCSNTGSLGTYSPVPCTVLDPFAGSATTMLVARNHGRHSIGIELNQQYLEIAAKRLQQLSLLA